MAAWARAVRGRAWAARAALGPPAAPVAGARACRGAAAGGGARARKKGPGGPGAKPAGAGGRRRLDDVCLELHPEFSKNVIQSFIAQGKVRVDDRVVFKAGHQTPARARVAVDAEQPHGGFVCRAGLKLEGALRAFDVDVAGKVALDAGLSTGGFTDCLLQRGAARVYGVDVGYGQVADKVRRDARVTVMERTNLRHLRAADFPERAQVATLDLSFISVLKVLDAVCGADGALDPGARSDLVVLVKPQFEAERHQVARGGVVKDPAVHREVVAKVVAGVEGRGFTFRGHIESPIKGASAGNTEFLCHFSREAAAEGGAEGGAETAAARG